MCFTSCIFLLATVLALHFQTSGSVRSSDDHGAMANSQFQRITVNARSLAKQARQHEGIGLHMLHTAGGGECPEALQDGNYIVHYDSKSGIKSDQKCKAAPTSGGPEESVEVDCCGKPLVYDGHVVKEGSWDRLKEVVWPEQIKSGELPPASAAKKFVCTEDVAWNNEKDKCMVGAESSKKLNDASMVLDVRCCEAVRDWKGVIPAAKTAALGEVEDERDVDMQDVGEDAGVKTTSLPKAEEQPPPPPAEGAKLEEGDMENGGNEPTQTSAAATSSSPATQVEGEQDGDDQEVVDDEPTQTSAAATSSSPATQVEGEQDGDEQDVEKDGGAEPARNVKQMAAQYESAHIRSYSTRLKEAHGCVKTSDKVKAPKGEKERADCMCELANGEASENIDPKLKKSRCDEATAQALQKLGWTCTFVNSKCKASPPEKTLTTAVETPMPGK